MLFGKSVAIGTWLPARRRDSTPTLFTRARHCEDFSAALF
jgi:hypothetical protein